MRNLLIVLSLFFSSVSWAAGFSGDFFLYPFSQTQEHRYPVKLEKVDGTWMFTMNGTTAPASRFFYRLQAENGKLTYLQFSGDGFLRIMKLAGFPTKKVFRADAAHFMNRVVSLNPEVQSETCYRYLDPCIYSPKTIKRFRTVIFDQFERFDTDTIWYEVQGDRGLYKFAFEGKFLGKSDPTVYESCILDLHESDGPGKIPCPAWDGEDPEP